MGQGGWGQMWGEGIEWVSRRRGGGDRVDGVRGGGRGQVTVDPEVELGSFLSF